MLTDCCRVLTSQIEPVKNRIGATMLNATNGPQAVAFDQHRHHIKKDGVICP
jgi:hypothetical protein